MSKFTSESAKKAGSKSKRGISEKTKQWDLLGEKVTGKYTERVFRYLDKLEDERFLDAYMNLLEYFKPKQARTQISSDPDNPLFDGVTIRVIDGAKGE